MTVSGVCDERFGKVREVLQGNLADGGDLGASVAVNLGGELVVDLWGGFCDPQRTTPWGRDTITNVWSTTKTMTALSALMLIDRGELDAHAPVARYWPEFAAGGKADIELRHLMSHTAGLPGWDEPLEVEDLYDWEKATSLLAGQTPWWKPGSASGYHAITQGYLVGEVVRRVTGQSLGEFFAAELAGPLGADFHIGLGPSDDARVSPVVPLPSLAGAAPVGSLAERALKNPVLGAAESWTEPWRRAEIPAANGHGNARSVVTVQSVLACGGETGGKRLFSSKLADVIFEEQANGTDLVLGSPLRHGIGYGLISPEVPLSPNEHACYWGGWGGSIVVIDIDARMTVAYMMNRMVDGLAGDLRGAGLVFAAYDALSS